jgi:hypothetical protein
MSPKMSENAEKMSLTLLKPPAPALRGPSWP